MATSLLTLLDDIAYLLDDVAVLSKVAAKKTASVLTDDLALNAEQVSGVNADRELPVVWAVCKGSLVNKAILVPAALLISAFAPWLITPLLMVGGAYLCFEGAEKLLHSFLHRQNPHPEANPALNLSPEALLERERSKIRGAIRTDFILSAEIIVITLGTLGEAPFLQQVLVMVTTAILMTFGVYGLVAAIVKLDDLGLYLNRKGHKTLQPFGKLLINAAPRLMKLLSIVGTAAMFMVGGGILVHGLPLIHHWVEGAGETVVHQLPVAGSILGALATTLLNAATGLLAGALLAGLIHLALKLKGSATA